MGQVSNKVQNDTQIVVIRRHWTQVSKISQERQNNADHYNIMPLCKTNNAGCSCLLIQSFTKHHFLFPYFRIQGVISCELHNFQNHPSKRGIKGMPEQTLSLICPYVDTSSILHALRGSLRLQWPQEWPTNKKHLLSGQSECEQQQTH